MSFLAILNSGRSVLELVRAGERPALVGTWSTATRDVCAELDIPCLLEDELLGPAERLAMQHHTSRLVRAVTGTTMPATTSYADWAWWALELPLLYVSSQGARTRRLVQAGLDRLGSRTAVVHDLEGWIQGAVINLTCQELEVPTAAFDPHDDRAETISRRHDYPLMPRPQDFVRPSWRGRTLPRSRAPRALVHHTNEIAHLMPDLLASRGRVLEFIQEERARWPATYDGPVARAEAREARAPLEDPGCPAALETLAEPWERELAVHLALLWQPHLVEEYEYARAAYAAAEVRLLVTGNDYFPEHRAKLLACRRLGIPTVLVQHGAFMGIEAGHPNHRYADHHLVWSREAARELDRAAFHGERWVIGWPQAGAHLAALRDEPVPPAPRKRFVILPSPTGAPWNAEASVLHGEAMLDDALTALAEVHPGAEIVVKCHPFHDNPDMIRGHCAERGFPDVRIETGLDPWTVLHGADGAITGSSTTLFAAAQLGVPFVVHLSGAGVTWLDRAPVAVTRTAAELAAALRALRPPAGPHPLASYARADAAPLPRKLAALRRIARGPRARRPRRAPQSIGSPA